MFASCTATSHCVDRRGVARRARTSSGFLLYCAPVRFAVLVVLLLVACNSDPVVGDLADLGAPAASDLAGAACTGALSPCAGNCVNVLYDRDHCGGCGHFCAVGGSCLDGQCICGMSRSVCAD